MSWKRALGKRQRRVWERVEHRARRAISDLPLLIDSSQLNRRTRRAAREGRGVRAAYLWMEHQRRRFKRRQEIRELVGH